jgi:hypothetical protein
MPSNRSFLEMKGKSKSIIGRQPKSEILILLGNRCFVLAVWNSLGLK